MLVGSHVAKLILHHNVANPQAVADLLDCEFLPLIQSLEIYYWLLAPILLGDQEQVQIKRGYFLNSFLPENFLPYVLLRGEGKVTLMLVVVLVPLNCV